MKIRIFETYDWTGDYIDVEATSARVTRQLMSRDEITITVEANEPIDFKIGMCVRDVGTPLFSYYFLNELPAYEKRAWNEHIYTLVFKAPMHDLDLVSFLSIDGETDFYYSGRASDFVNLILSNMSRGRVAWVAGTSDVTEYRNIQFSSLTCWGALQLIADEFDLEFDIQEVPASEPMQCSIALKSKVQYTGALELYVGPEGGIYNLKRTSVDYDKLVTRLYYRGSDRNLPPSYAYEKLRGSANYIESNVDLFGLKEGVKVFDEVYPHYEGVVTGFEIAADGKQYLTDSSFPFDLKEEIDGSTTYLIAGTTAKINFLTGNCAGLTLDIADYKHATKQFRLIVFKDERGYEQPNATVQPAAGDKYVIFDIKMPTAYVTNAVTALDAAAAAHLAEVSTPRVAYTLETGVKWASSLGVILEPATEIAITDVDLSLTEACRVVEVSYSLFDPYKATAKLSDVRFPVPGRAVVNLLKDVNKVIKVSKANQVERFQKNMKTTNELKSLTFDPQDEKFLPENTRVESVDPVTLALDSGEIQFHLEGVEFNPNFEDDPNALHVSAGTFVHHSANAKYRSEIEAIQAAGGTYTPFRSWNIAETTFSLSAGEQHIYAKVHTASDAFGTPYTDAEVVLSSVPLWAKKDVGYTYFRIGSISDVDAETDTRATKTLWPKVEKSAPGAKNFIELQDADSSYPTNGNVVKGSADGVPFAENLGDDGAVWVRSQLSESLGANLGFTSSTSLEAGKTYQIMVIINGRTAGNVAIKINSSTIATVTQTAFVAYTAASTGAHNCEAVASVDFDGTISLITIKEVIAVSRKGLKFVDGAHGTIAELLAFADNLAWGATMPADFAGSGNVYIGASPESGDESNKVRLAEVLYDRLLKQLTLKGTIELNKDTDNEYKLPETTPEIASGEESKKFAMTRTGDNAALGWFELLDFISRAAVEAGTVGNVPRITEVGGVRNVTWGAALAPTAAPSAPSVAIYAADGSITYVGYQHATDPAIKRAKVLSTDAYDAMVTAGTVDANVIYLQYEED